MSRNETANEGYKSPDLKRPATDILPETFSEYPGECPYFDSCGLLDPGKKICQNADQPYSFSGYIGKVMEIPANLADPDGIYKVTFNDGRTSYDFVLANLEMYEPDYNYEMWFVQVSESCHAA